MSKLKQGFSPTLHLLNALNTTIQGSITRVSKCTESENTGICNKIRQKNIHVCVDIKDNLIMLALCNGQEACARTSIIHTYHERTNYTIVQEILEVLRKTSLNIEIEAGFSGGCNKILQTIAMTPMPIDNVKPVPKRARRYKVMSAQKTGIDILDQENCEIFSKRFPDPIDWSNKPEVEEVYRNLLMIRSSERIIMEMDGTFVLKEPIKLLSDVGKEKDKEELWWQDGWTKLCAITPHIVERLPDSKGMRIHCIKISSNCLATMLVETDDFLESQEKNPNATSGKEEESMSPKYSVKFPGEIPMSPVMLEVYNQLLDIAEDKNSANVQIEGYRKILMAKYPKKDHARIDFQVRNLVKKGFAEIVQKGTIKVQRVEVVLKEKPTKKKVSKKKVTKKKVAKKTSGRKKDKTETPSISSNSNPSEQVELKREELEGCSEKGDQNNSQITRLAPDPSTSKQLIALLSRIEEPEKLATNLLEDLNVEKLYALHTMFRITELLKSDERCPEFKEHEEGLQVTMVI